MELASKTDFRHVFQLQVPNQRRSYRLNHLQKGKMTDMLKRLLQFSKAALPLKCFLDFEETDRRGPLCGTLCKEEAIRVMGETPY